MEDSENHKWIIKIVEEGSKSDYGKILKEAIREWIIEENRRLDSYKKNGISGDEIDKYNRTVDRMEYLKRMLGMNEVIISYHRTFLEKVKLAANEFVCESNSFIKEFLK